MEAQKLMREPGNKHSPPNGKTRVEPVSQGLNLLHQCFLGHLYHLLQARRKQFASGEAKGLRSSLCARRSPPREARKFFWI